MCTNQTHGPSVVAIAKDYRQSLIDSFFVATEMSDPKFEIVYVSIETFADGYKRDNVIYRVTNPAWEPKKRGNSGQDTITDKKSWTHEPEHFLVEDTKP